MKSESKMKFNFIFFFNNRGNRIFLSLYICISCCEKEKNTSYLFSVRHVIEADVKAVLCTRNFCICKRMHRFGYVPALC